jgi:uncharacterized protein
MTSTSKEKPVFVGPTLPAQRIVSLDALRGVAIMLICQAGKLKNLTARFAAVGRMALTNYLMHGIICGFIFHGYGLGLVGKVERTGQILIVFAVWIFQLWYSPLWLKRFRFGPAEWLWRSLTYWKLQPLKKDG